MRSNSIASSAGGSINADLLAPPDGWPIAGSEVQAQVAPDQELTSTRATRPPGSA